MIFVLKMGTSNQDLYNKMNLKYVYSYKIVKNMQTYRKQYNFQKKALFNLSIKRFLTKKKISERFKENYFGLIIVIF